MSQWMKRVGISLLIVGMLSSASLGVFASEVDEDINFAVDTEEVIFVGNEESEEVITLSSDPMVNLMNAQVLTSTPSASPELDAYLDELLATLITEDMDTYTKVKTCYDYLVDNMRYGSHTAGLGTMVNGVSCRSIYSQYGDVEGFGAVALTTKQGMCNAYSAAFCLMVRKIGLKADLVSGTTKGAGGSYVYHEWAEMELDGVKYVFDPQLEQSLSKYSVFGDYTVFYKTYEQVGSRYRKA